MSSALSGIQVFLFILSSSILKSTNGTGSSGGLRVSQHNGEGIYRVRRLASTNFSSEFKKEEAPQIDSNRPKSNPESSTLPYSLIDVIPQSLPPTLDLTPHDTFPPEITTDEQKIVELEKIPDQNEVKGAETKMTKQTSNNSQELETKIGTDHNENKENLQPTQVSIILTNNFDNSELPDAGNCPKHHEASQNTNVYNHIQSDITHHYSQHYYCSSNINQPVENCCSSCCRGEISQPSGGLCCGSMISPQLGGCCCSCCGHSFSQPTVSCSCGSQITPPEGGSCCGHTFSQPTVDCSCGSQITPPEGGSCCGHTFSQPTVDCSCGSQITPPEGGSCCGHTFSQPTVDCSYGSQMTPPEEEWCCSCCRSKPTVEFCCGSKISPSEEDRCSSTKIIPPEGSCDCRCCRSKPTVGCGCNSKISQRAGDGCCSPKVSPPGGRCCSDCKSKCLNKLRRCIQLAKTLGEGIATTMSRGLKDITR